MECTYELIDVLDKSDIVKNITKYKERIMNNNEIRELVRQGNNEKDEYVVRDIRQKLYTYDDYRGYMDNYNKLMDIVREINYRMKKLTDVRGCKLWELLVVVWKVERLRDMI